MTFIQYYWRWIATAINPTFHLSDGLGSLLGFLGPKVVDLINRGNGEPMDQASWQEIGFYVLVAVLGLRIILAPYWMHIEATKDAAKTQESPEVQRLRTVRELLLKQAKRSPKWCSRKAANQWQQETVIQLHECIRGNAPDQFKDCTKEIQSGKDLKIAVKKGRAYLESLASRLHQNDLRQYPGI